MAERRELRILQKEFKDATIFDYVDNHLSKEREFLPLCENSFETFQKNFKAKEEIRRISTGSHMAFLQWEEAFGLGENMMANIVNLLEESPQVPAVPYSRISFKNSTRPGSINLSNFGTDHVKLNRYTIRGRSKVTVHNAAKITHEEMDNFLFDLKKVRKNPNLFSFVNQEKLDIFIDRCNKMVDKGNTFNEQASWFSSNLWKELFDFKTEPLVVKPMETLKLDRENLLETADQRKVMEDVFVDTYGATNQTYFYYGSCRCGKEFPLEKINQNGHEFLQGECIDSDCEFKEKITYEFSDLIEKRTLDELNDTLLTSFYSTWAMTGVDVMGGFVQIEYIKDFKNKLSKTFKKLGDEKRSDIIKKRASNLLDLSVIPLYNKDGSEKPGSQVFLEGGISRDHVKKFSKMNFVDAVDISLETIDNYINRKKDFSNVLDMIKKKGQEFLIR